MHHFHISQLDLTPKRINANPNFDLEGDVLIKAVAIGDSTVGTWFVVFIEGKTHMLVRYCHPFLQQYCSPALDNYSIKHLVNGTSHSVTLELRDTASGDDYARLRPFNYQNVNVFILCFALNSPVSLENAASKWMGEIQHYSPGTPLVLVGTKADLRDETDHSLGSVSTEKGKEVAASLNALAYVECSALTGEGISQVFEATLWAGVSTSPMTKKKCIVS